MKPRKKNWRADLWKARCLDACAINKDLRRENVLLNMERHEYARLIITMDRAIHGHKLTAHERARLNGEAYMNAYALRGCK